MKIHLVDGTYELFRAHYSPRPGRTALDGTDIKATHGLAQSLIALLNQPDVTHVGVAFDSVIRSFRNDMFDGYKTGDGVEPGLLAQFPLAEQMSEALGLTVWPMVEFEADDALATAAVRFAGHGDVEQVLMCSPDKDLAQAVSGQRIVALDRRKGEVMDEAGVVEKFGVPPASIPDYLALVGDSADGIPRHTALGSPNHGYGADALREHGRDPAGCRRMGHQRTGCGWIGRGAGGADGRRATLSPAGDAEAGRAAIGNRPRPAALEGCPAT